MIGRRRREIDNPPPMSRNTPMDPQLDKLKFDAAGLVAAIIQDWQTGQLLALFWMNKEAIEKTSATGNVHSYSRSRGRLALKGESSGHYEIVKEVLADC